MWTPGHFKLFISHISAQRETAHAIKEALKSFQISGFVAHDDIQPTREWQDEIENALQTMDALAALLTQGFHESNWTDQEVGFAMGSSRLVLPMRFGIDPYGFIGKFQGYTIQPNTFYTKIAEDIALILARHLTTSEKMADALTTRFESSWSWESAKKTMSMLEECPVISEPVLQRIEDAGQNNGQIREAWGVPDRIQNLLRRHRQIGDLQ